MSTQPQAAPWSAQEDLALLEGALKCGINQWKEVLLQPKFARLMKEKEQADLQARWRLGFLSNAPDLNFKVCAFFQGARSAWLCAPEYG